MPWDTKLVSPYVPVSVEDPERQQEMINSAMEAYVDMLEQQDRESVR